MERRYTKANPLRVFTAFSGYDSQCMALDRLGIDYELVGWSDIDKYAIQAHNAVYPQYGERNHGDISKIEWGNVPDFDLFTYSFPCQDISSAGKQGGLEEGSGTRSSLLWECRRAIEAKRPKYLLMENVKALTQKKFLPYLHKWMACLEGMGYSNHAKVLNAKDYGVPQNRERVFMVSVLGSGGYGFPKPFELKSRLMDVLEEDVDESYYLSDKTVQYFVYRNKVAESKGNGFFFRPLNRDCIANTITVRAGSRTTDNYVCIPLLPHLSCAMRGRNPDNPSDRTAGMDTEQRLEIGGDVANCINTVQKDSMVLEPFIKQCNTLHASTGSGGNTDCFVVEPYKHSDKDNMDLCVKYKGKYYRNGDGLYLNTSESFNRGGLSALSRTLKAETHDAGVVDCYRIRKLTPRECFRLMGVSEDDIDKIQSAGVSKTQQYKMAGNSIVVDVLYHIFRKLFFPDENSKYLSLF